MKGFYILVPIALFVSLRECDLLFTGLPMANPVEFAFCLFVFFFFFLLGCLWQSQLESGWDLFVFFFLFFLFFLFIIIIFSSVSVKVLPVTPLVSGVFVHRAFWAYFLRIERVVEMRRFLWWTQETH